MKTRTLFLTFAVALAAGGFACREEGAAEKAGKKVDEAVEDVHNGVNDAAEDLGDQAEDLKEKATE